MQHNSKRKSKIFVFLYIINSFYENNLFILTIKEEGNILFCIQTNDEHQNKAS